MRGAARIGGSGQASAGTARCPHTAPRLARQARAAPGPSAAATCGACTAPAGPGTPWQGLARPGEGAPPVRRAPGRPAGAQGGPGPARQRRAAPPQLWRLWQDSSDTPYPTQAGARLPRAAPLLARQAREAVRVQRGRLGERQVDDALVAAQRGQLRHHLAQVARARHLRGRRQAWAQTLTLTTCALFLAPLHGRSAAAAPPGPGHTRAAPARAAQGWVPTLHPAMCT